MALRNRIIKFLRTASFKFPPLKNALRLLNVFNLPRKTYIWARLNLSLIPKLPICANEKNCGSGEVIVSLTSFGKRVSKTLHYTLFTLLSQSQKPSRIIVWLDKDNWKNKNAGSGEFLPKYLKKLQGFGVEVKFCKDIGSYTKLIPALREFPENSIVTADDDLYYPKNWLSQLLDKHAENSNCICVHRAHEITFKDGKIEPYSNWRHAVKRVENPQNIFLTGVGGVFYPPHSLHPMATDENLFLRLSPKGDDIWLWAMAKLQKTKCVIVEGGYSKLKYIDIADELSGLTVANVVNNKNDEQIRAVIEYFNFTF